MSWEYAVHVTVVTPAENGKSIGRRTQFSPLTSQLYIALPSLRVPTTVTLSPVVVGVPKTTEASQSLLAFTSLFAGQLMVGGLVPLSSTCDYKATAPVAFRRTDAYLSIPHREERA
jgi:hypothetical protein